MRPTNELLRERHCIKCQACVKLEWAERCVGCALSTKVKWWQRETIHMLFSKARLARLVEHLVYIQDAWVQYLAIIIRLERSEPASEPLLPVSVMAPLPTTICLVGYPVSWESLEQYRIQNTLPKYNSRSLLEDLESK